MTLTVASIFRNSTGYIDRYFAQINALRERIDVDLVLAEGDSTDDTWERLNAAQDGLVLKVDHGGPHYGSVDHPNRWADIALVVRTVIANAGNPERFMWIESDLIWEPDTILHLLKDLDEVPAVAPMVLKQGTTTFYDYWGFRKNGELFMRYAPYYWEPDPDARLVKIDSCGSCFVTRAFEQVQRWDGIWPYPGDLWLDPEQEIFHP